MPDQDNSVPRGRLRRTVPLAGFAARAAGGRLAAEVRERTGDGGAVERFNAPPTATPNCWATIAACC